MLVKLLSLLSLGVLALASPAAAGTFIPRQPLAKLQPMPQQQQTEQVSELTKAVLTLDHKYSSALRKQQSAMVDFGLNATASAPATMSRDYNAATAKQLYWLSSTAYCTDNANLSAWNCNTCRNFGAFTVTAVMDDTDNQGYVGYFTQGLPSAPMPGVGADEPFVVVAFRGTMPNDFKDWLEDLNFAKATPFGSTGANVHTGFWQAYLDMRPKLLGGLEAAFSQSGARGLIVVGHSLGGAMAELAAVDLKLNYYTSKVYASYTQGTPRPGDAKWAQLYANTVAASFREIHYADVVPHLPPHLLGFTHSSTEVWFDEAFANYTVCSGDNGEDPACAQSLTLPISIPDHLSYHGTVPMACTDA